jgi:hypothetical protein
MAEYEAQMEGDRVLTQENFENVTQHHEMSRLGEF